MDLVGKRTRYIYLPYSSKDPKEFSCQTEKDNEYFTGFFKFDTKTDKIVNKVDFGENMTAGELTYQQRSTSDSSEKEDDGYLITNVHNWKTDSSHFTVWDA